MKNNIIFKQCTCKYLPQKYNLKNEEILKSSTDYYTILFLIINKKPKIIIITMSCKIGNKNSISF